MFWNRSIATIFQRWQSEIDHSLETGQTPLLQLGEDDALLDALPGLAALQEMVDRRVLVNTPLILSGGRSAAWLLALWQRRSTPELARSSGVRVVFAGADAATYIASTTISAEAEKERLHHWREVRPLALASRIEPESQPAVPPTLQETPMVVMNSTWYAAENSLQDWVAWLAVAMIVIIIVFSVLL